MPYNRACGMAGAFFCLVTIEAAATTMACGYIPSPSMGDVQAATRANHVGGTGPRGRARFRRRSGHDRARTEGLACSLLPQGRPVGRSQTFSRRARCNQEGPRMLRVIRVPATAAGRWLRSIRPERRYLRADLTAGLPGAISSVPDGMAAAVLVGVNPVQGLYAALRGSDRRRPQLEYAADGNHDDLRRRAGGGLGAAGRAR